MSEVIPVPSPQSPVPKTLRVLMLAPTPYFADRGCHVRIYEEARALMEAGCDVRIVTYHIGRDMPGIPTVRIPSIPWYNRLTAGPSWFKPFLDILLFFKAWRYSLEFRPQVIHAHLHEGALIGLLLKYLLGIPLLMDFQGSLTVECRDHGFFKPGSVLERLFSTMERAINKSADMIITSSSEGARFLMDHFGLGSDRVTPVIDGVDTNRFAPHGAKAAARRELGLPEGVPVVVYLGLLNMYQGTDLLVDTIALLRNSRTPVHFLVMGYPEEGYRQKIRSLGLERMVSFTGRIEYDKVPFYLGAGDIAVSPKLSLTEANGKLFNYMACGLPTIVFDTPVNREILGETGIYAPYGDAAALATAITTILQDRDGLARLADWVRQRARQQHSWQARAETIRSLYSRLLASRGITG